MNEGSTCRRYPDQEEGPFYLEGQPRRTDIREQCPGAPLVLRLTIVDERCAPIEGAEVDVWHANAEGLYSGVGSQGEGARGDTRGRTFLRGRTSTDRDGVATLTTIYPGWYEGRTTHIHVKIRLDGRELLTSQIYFPEEATEAVYRTFPYAARGPKGTPNDADAVRAGAAPPVLELIADGRGGYAGELTIPVRG